MELTKGFVQHCNRPSVLRDFLLQAMEQNEKLEAEHESLLQQNRELCQALQVMYSKEEYDKQKYKRCLAMAKWCEAILNQYPSFGEISAEERRLDKWCKRWLKLATKFKEAK